MPPQTPHITSTAPLSPNTAKWIEFLHLTYMDSHGVLRTWEACGRKTRGSSGIDAVAVFALLKSSRGNAISTILALQYRPPVDAVCVEFPAGLIDKDESPEVAAVRELIEETGFEGKVVGCSPIVVSNPGMSTGNMCVVTVEVDVEGEGEVEMPKQRLDDGEDIEVVVVPLDELYERLVKYSEEGKKVDSRLWHTAMGLRLARQLK
jgi:ADP-ribose pyrophosphatase